MSGDTGRQSSSDVAHEAEDTRAHLASTLEQLRNNLKPENVMEEVVSNARIGASSVADNLLGAAKDFPLPAVLIAAGAALIMGVASKGLGRTGRRPSLPRASTLSRPKTSGFEPAPGRRQDATRRTTAGVAVTASSLRDDVRDALSDRSARVSESMGGLRRQASATYDSTSSKARGAMQNASKYLPQDSGEVKSKLSMLLDEQPLILGVIGLAVGAAIGAALPITETEDSLMGNTAHSVRQAAQDAARQEIEGLRAVAGEAVDNVKKAATDHGLSTDNLNDLVRDVGSHAKTAVNKVGTSLDAQKNQG